MSTNTPKQFADDEVDLKAISGSIGKFFRGIERIFFKSFEYLIRNIIWIVLIIAVGFALGYFLDEQDRPYEHEVIVRPNFNSAHYLYSKVDYLSSIIRERDTVSIKKLGVNSPEKLLGVKLEPIVDVYNFVSRHELNFKTLELLAEDGDLNKIVMEPTTSMNYTHHMLTIVTRQKTSREAVVKPIMDFFNDSPYYASVKAESVNNVKSKMKTNEVLIAQIDAILESVAQKTVTGGTVVNSESQLDNVIRTKDALIEEQGFFRVELHNLTDIVKPTSVVLNIERNKKLDDKMKFVLPILFVVLFVFIQNFFRVYRNYKRRAIPA